MSEGECPTIAIIGGGCSGVLVAANLVREARRPLRIVIIEASGALGPGTAYATRNPAHLLNTRASDMSAFVDEPHDFIAWAHDAGRELSGEEFVPRRLYGEYLTGLLERTVLRANVSVRVETVAQRAEALAVRERLGRRVVIIGLHDGSHVEADCAVLATGVPNPRGFFADWPIEASPRALISTPWQPGAFAEIPESADVLLIGTGLTMTDVAIELGASHTRHLYARSRHGLVPLAHRWTRSPSTIDVPAVIGAQQPDTARQVVRAIRLACEQNAARGGDWRDVVTEVRALIPDLWSALGTHEQARVLRHALRYWEVHRHRLAPNIARELKTLVDVGTLSIGKGRVESFAARGGRVAVTLRSGEHIEQLVVDAVVDCTGPSHDPVQGSRLVHSLLENRLASRGPHGIGLATDERGRLLSAFAEDLPLFTLGWPRRGDLLESTSVPELRVQAARVAEYVAGGQLALGVG